MLLTKVGVFSRGRPSDALAHEPTWQARNLDNGSLRMLIPVADVFAAHAAKCASSDHKCHPVLSKSLERRRAAWLDSGTTGTKVFKVSGSLLSSERQLRPKGR